VHVAAPSGVGPYPLIIFGPSLQVPASQYSGNAQRLASFGYIAIVADYPVSVLNPNNPSAAHDLLGAIDWAQGVEPRLSGRVDSQKIGVSGHAFGGKIALLAATYDPRVKASFVIDPIDSGGATSCTAPACVSVKTLMPNLHIPTGFIGETLDATGVGQACAPAADNFTTFYAGATSPSLEVTDLGASLMSFLDNRQSCSVCAYCKTGTESDAQANATSRAFMVAFFERYLRQDTGYDTWLTGSQAQTHFVATGEVTIVSK
jgi:dienelactone hydrolase